MFIITGANKGLGKAFYDILAGSKTNSLNYIVSLSRRKATDQGVDNNKFIFIPVDFKEIHDTAFLERLDKFKSEIDKIVFISNAGTLEPVGKAGQLSDQAVIDSIQVNIIAPVLITNHILKNFSGKKIDIINISSGAGKRAIQGWMMYCSGKAFMNMFFDVMDKDKTDDGNVRVFNINPGVIDTDMQSAIRNADIHEFPEKEKFKALHETGQLKKPYDVAMDILKSIEII